ncbi:winged helix-turn-helix transcriptional regulator [Geodermatophilus sp. SYSU D00710]
MGGYGQYCPLALGAEVFAQRWTPIIVRNLALGCVHFGDILEGAPGLSRSVLAQRLHTLERDGVVERRRSGRTTEYTLTRMGRELDDVCAALGRWGARWREVAPGDHDPYLALWILARLIDPASLPRPRVVVRFDVRRSRAPHHLWLLLDRTGNEVCVETPGFPDDGVVATDVASLVRWCAGRLGLAAALESRQMVLAGPPWLERELTRWGGLSPYAGVEPARSPHLVS